VHRPRAKEEAEKGNTDGKITNGHGRLTSYSCTQSPGAVPKWGRLMAWLPKGTVRW